MTDLIAVERIREAAERIAPHVLRTPTVASPGLADLLGVEVALKLEILQHSGCFKPRGITNKILSLSPEERAAGLLTVSGGNHGLALSRITAGMGIRATVVMPEAAPARSKAAVRSNGATLRLVPDVATAFDVADRERGAGLTYVHAYDDPLIIAGHGTLGLELIADAPGLTDVLVSIGGGALISGIATAVRAAKPSVRIWGVETGGADAMTRAIAAGRPVPVGVTSIVSTLGAPVVSDRTLAHVKALVEDVLVVDDAEAVDGVLTLAEEAKVWVEPAAGCLLPAARRVVAQVGPDAVLGLVLCGGNASFADITAWAQRFGVQR
jgi:threonine dehydratase